MRVYLSENKILKSVQIMAKPVLYTYFRSSCSWRVRIALNLKGIEYESKAVNLIKDGGQQRKSEYSGVNPMQQVPSIEINGHTLTQSAAIIEFLDEAHPSPPLFPKDPLKKAQVREICEVIGSGIQPLQNLVVLQKIGDEKKQEWAKFWIEKGFTALEKMLQKTVGKYSVGDEITMADLFLVPQVDNANRFGVNMESFPTIAKLNEELSKLEAFKLAHPFAQPDCPEDLRLK